MGVFALLRTRHLFSEQERIPQHGVGGVWCCSCTPLSLVLLGRVCPTSGVHVCHCGVISEPPSVTLQYSSLYVRVVWQYFSGNVTHMSQSCPPHCTKLCPASLFSQVYGWISAQWQIDTSRTDVPAGVGVNVLSHYEEGWKRPAGCKQSTCMAGCCVPSKVLGKVKVGAGFHFLTEIINLNAYRFSILSGTVLCSLARGPSLARGCLGVSWSCLTMGQSPWRGLCGLVASLE